MAVSRQAQERLTRQNQKLAEENEKQRCSALKYSHLWEQVVRAVSSELGEEQSVQSFAVLAQQKGVPDSFRAYAIAEEVHISMVRCIYVVGGWSACASNGIRGGTVSIDCFFGYAGGNSGAN